MLSSPCCHHGPSSKVPVCPSSEAPDVIAARSLKCPMSSPSVFGSPRDVIGVVCYSEEHRPRPLPAAPPAAQRALPARPDGVRRRPGG